MMFMIFISLYYIDIQLFKCIINTKMREGTLKH